MLFPAYQIFVIQKASNDLLINISKMKLIECPKHTENKPSGLSFQ